MKNISILSRRITPFEHLIAGHLCDGLSNAAIARETSHSEKVVENTLARMAKALSVKSAPDINIRVRIALIYRAHFGDGAFDKLNLQCNHFEIDEDGHSICSRHIT